MSEKPSILIVDDDVDLLGQLAFLLEDDCEVDSAAAKDEAVEKIDAGPYDVYLIDICLQKGDSSTNEGLELSSLLRNRSKEATIINFSRYNPERYRELSKQAGADAFLRKPFSPEELMELIHSLRSEN